MVAQLDISIAEIVIQRNKKAIKFIAQMERLTLLTKYTCMKCRENKCEIRDTCPDDETSIEKRKQIYEELPEVETE
jgi:hypothetical protein